MLEGPVKYIDIVDQCSACGGTESYERYPTHRTANHPVYVGGTYIVFKCALCGTEDATYTVIKVTHSKNQND